MKKILLYIILLLTQITIPLLLGYGLSRFYYQRNNWGDIIGMVIGLNLGYWLVTSMIFIILLKKKKSKLPILLLVPIILPIFYILLIWLFTLFNINILITFITIIIIINILIILLLFNNKEKIN